MQKNILLTLMLSLVATTGGSTAGAKTASNWSIITEKQNYNFQFKTIIKTKLLQVTTKDSDGNIYFATFKNEHWTSRIK